MDQFNIDNRSNPELHRLYVRYAIEELTVINDFIDRMMGFSRITAFMISGEVAKKRNELILQDAAFFDAAAYMAAGKIADDFHDRKTEFPLDELKEE